MRKISTRNATLKTVRELLREGELEAAEATDFEAELQDEFNVAQFVLETGADSLGEVGEFLGPSGVKGPAALEEVSARLRALDEVGQRPIT